jgi:hypothetical protein
MKTTEFVLSAVFFWSCSFASVGALSLVFITPMTTIFISSSTASAALINAFKSAHPACKEGDCSSIRGTATSYNTALSASPHAFQKTKRRSCIRRSGRVHPISTATNPSSNSKMLIQATFRNTSSTSSSSSSWERCYQNLVKYYQKHGHCDVPKVDHHNIRLSRWYVSLC